MQVNVHEAKTQLSKLIEAAVRGEEVIIAKGDVPVAVLVPFRKKRFRMGIPELIGLPCPDFLEPMSEEELQLWE
jgi:prevent-host-death family protein